MTRFELEKQFEKQFKNWLELSGNQCLELPILSDLDSAFSGNESVIDSVALFILFCKLNKKLKCALELVEFV